MTMVTSEVIRLIGQTLFATFNASVIVYIAGERRSNANFRSGFFDLFLALSTVELCFCLTVCNLTLDSSDIRLKFLARNLD